ncbi:MAG: flagellar assembly protein FliX [Micropepsaceae bacterium]
MKIDAPRPIDSNRATRGRAAVGGVGGFSLESSAEPKATAAASGAASLSSVDALIALQQIPDAVTGRAKAARRGRDMLDVLEDVRDGLLTGSVSRATLQRLLALVNVKREEFVDPALAEVLNEIDLRARVELAKLNFADAN